jgi:hypothetical protein
VLVGLTWAGPGPPDRNEVAASAPTPPPSDAPEGTMETVPPPDDVAEVTMHDELGPRVRAVVGDRIGLTWLNEQPGPAGLMFIGVKDLTVDEAARITRSLPHPDRVRLVPVTYSFVDLDGFVKAGSAAMSPLDRYGIGIGLDGRDATARPFIEAEAVGLRADVVAALEAAIPADLLRVENVREEDWLSRLGTG